MQRTRHTLIKPDSFTRIVFFFSSLNFGVADNILFPFISFSQVLLAAFPLQRNFLILHSYCRRLLRWVWDTFDLALEVGHVGRQNSHRIQVHLKLLQVIQFLHLRHEILKRVRNLVWLTRLCCRVEAARTNHTQPRERPTGT